MCRKVSEGSKDLAAVQTPSSPGAEPGTCQAWGWGQVGSAPARRGLPPAQEALRLYPCQ